MKAGLAAVLPRPSWTRTDETDTRSIGVVVDLPRSSEELFDIFIGEEIGCAMRTIENADLPFMRVPRHQRIGQREWRNRQVVTVEPSNHVAGAERASAVPAEFSENESRTAVEIFRHIDPAANGDIGARPPLRCGAETQDGSAVGADRAP
jgi:hypothetical protein